MTLSTPDESYLAGLLDDRASEGLFRIRPEAFTDPAVFELEMSRIFERTWIFIGLGSEVAAPHDFVTRQIGRRSVILMRAADGSLGCFLNSCRHRGTLLCPFSHGNTRLHVCRYHGWTYDSAGNNVGVTHRSEGEYPPSFDAHNHNLIPVAALDQYRGFVFASLAGDVVPLETHLGEARLMLDLVADQAPEGLEFVPGTASYTFDGNWKMQFENGLDAYHFPATHAAFVNIVRQRPTAAAPANSVAAWPAPEHVAAGTISFPRGHAMSWSIGAPGQDAQSRPLTRDPALFDSVRRRVGDARLDWMLRQRNLTVFPNLQVIDIQSLQMRMWEPLAVDKTRMISRCLAPIGESHDARRFRIRQYEEFFNAGGLATSDDNVMYEFGQKGFSASTEAPMYAYARGLNAAKSAADDVAVLGLTDAVTTYSDAGLPFGDETGIHSGYREWHRLITDSGIHGSGAAER